MKVKPEHLQAQLDKTLAPVYLITGDETLLVQEACDQIRSSAKGRGFSERELYYADNNLDWRQLYESVQSGSLFAERKVVELQIPAAKISEPAAQFILSFCQQPSDDNLILVRCGRLDKKALASKWAKALDDTGVIVQIWPVELAQLPRWIEQRLQQRGLTIAPDALQLLTERVEGNLLAAHQEIEKLHILTDQNHLTLEEVNRCVVDSARFNLFDLVDECLKGEATHALRIISGLSAEGVEPVLVVWALAREVRTLDGLRLKIERGQSMDQVLNHPSILKKRVPAIRMALRRHSLSSLLDIINLLRRADQAVKGSDEDTWTLLRDACLKLCGTSVLDSSLP